MKICRKCAFPAWFLLLKQGVDFPGSRRGRVLLSPSALSSQLEVSPLLMPPQSGRVCVCQCPSLPATVLVTAASSPEC